MASIDKKQT